MEEPVDLNMSFEKQLLFIKATQREFYKKFGHHLVIDFARTKGIINPDLPIRQRDQISFQEMVMKFDECLLKYGADKERILNRRRIQGPEYRREELALADFCQKAVTSGWSTLSAGKIINRHHAVVYHYARKAQRLADVLLD